ncbi:MAG TPA: hypothetical protein [Caudoviricetes sp.]|nr:MAG TPA: hypothetical protein [Caudoviricetes sp.]
MDNILRIFRTNIVIKNGIHQVEIFFCWMIAGRWVWWCRRNICKTICNSPLVTIIGNQFIITLNIIGFNGPCMIGVEIFPNPVPAPSITNTNSIIERAVTHQMDCRIDRPHTESILIISVKHYFSIYIDFFWLWSRIESHCNSGSIGILGIPSTAISLFMTIVISRSIALQLICYTNSILIPPIWI